MSFRSRSLVLFIRTFSMGAEQKKKENAQSCAPDCAIFFTSDSTACVWSDVCEPRWRKNGQYSKKKTWSKWRQHAKM